MSHRYTIEVNLPQSSHRETHQFCPLCTGTISEMIRSNVHIRLLKVTTTPKQSSHGDSLLMELDYITSDCWQYKNVKVLKKSFEMTNPLFYQLPLVCM